MNDNETIDAVAQDQENWQSMVEGHEDDQIFAEIETGRQ